MHEPTKNLSGDNGSTIGGIQVLAVTTKFDFVGFYIMYWK